MHLTSMTCQCARRHCWGRQRPTPPAFGPRQVRQRSASDCLPSCVSIQQCSLARLAVSSFACAINQNICCRHPPPVCRAAPGHRVACAEPGGGHTGDGLRHDAGSLPQRLDAQGRARVSRRLLSAGCPCPCQAACTLRTGLVQRGTKHSPTNAHTPAATTRCPLRAAAATRPRCPGPSLRLFATRGGRAARGHAPAAQAAASPPQQSDLSNFFQLDTTCKTITPLALP